MCHLFSSWWSFPTVFNILSGEGFNISVSSFLCMNSCDCRRIAVNIGEEIFEVAWRSNGFVLSIVAEILRNKITKRKNVSRVLST